MQRLQVRGLVIVKNSGKFKFHLTPNTAPTQHRHNTDH